MKNNLEKHSDHIKIIGLLIFLFVAFSLCLSFALAIKNTVNREDIILYKGQYYYCLWGTRCREDIPHEFSKVGKLTTIEHEMPTEELQMKICPGFEVSGTVFASENNPDVLYINYHAEYIGMGEYRGTAKFVTERVMYDYYIYHQGQLYKKERYSYHSGMYHYGFPDNSVEGEFLSYTGDKFLMPTAEDETNWGNGSNELFDDDVRILYDPDDNSKIYTFAYEKEIRDNMDNVIDTIEAYHVWRLVREK